jgi:DnaJ like chaperone protein
MKFSDRVVEAIEEARKRTITAMFEALAAMKARRDESTFSIALIALSAKIAKADGAVTDKETDAFRKFFEYPEEEASKVRMIYDLAKQDVAGFDHYVAQVAKIFDDDPTVLEDVLDCLLYVALADGLAHPHELALLEAAAATFKLRPGAWRRLKAVHLGAEDDDPWLILGLEQGAPIETVRTRYRELMREHHPDALIARGVPPSLTKIAAHRAAAVNRAYERVLAEVGR